MLTGVPGRGLSRGGAMKGRSVEKVVLTLYNAYSYTGMAVNDGDQTQQVRGSPEWSGGSPEWSGSSGSGRFSGSKLHGQLLGIRIHSADP